MPFIRQSSYLLPLIDLGVNGAYFRVHHFAPQGASPIPLLSAVAARTAHIEVGTGIIDMR